MDKQVYSSYAFKSDEKEKWTSNYNLIKEINSKYKVAVVPKGMMPEDTEPYDLIIERDGRYHHSECYVRKNTTDLSEAQIALMCDQHYKLCYGYTKKPGYFYIFED